MDRGRMLAAMAKKMSNLKENILSESNETNSSYDIEITSSTLTKLCQAENKISDYSGNEMSQTETEEDIFHETDFDDSDYIPSEKSSESEQNSTSESIRAMASALRVKHG